jgi:hypothetical protein
MGSGQNTLESSLRGTAGLQNSTWWHENGEGVAVVVTDRFNGRSRGGDKLATTDKAGSL